MHICVVIDHFSRRVMSVTPLEGPNAGWINNALESAIEKLGAPKHIISDQASVFTGGAFAELLRQWNVKLRFGAVGKHGGYLFNSTCRIFYSQRATTENLVNLRWSDGRLTSANGANGIRTHDLLHAMQALSQLSYGPRILTFGR